MPTVHHIALKVADLKRCARFYADVLRLAPSAEHRRDDGSLRSVWFAVGGGLLMLEQGEVDAPPHVAERGWHLVALTIAAPERTAWSARLAAAGVAIERESEFSLFFRDPEGNRLALSHYPEPFTGKNSRR